MNNYREISYKMEASDTNWKVTVSKNDALCNIWVQREDDIQNGMEHICINSQHLLEQLHFMLGQIIGQIERPNKGRI